MATITIGAAGIDMTQLDVSGLVDGVITTESSTTVVDDYNGQVDTFTGIGFTFDSSGVPTGGTVTGLQEIDNGQVAFDVTGMSVPATSFVTWATNGDTVGAVVGVLAGDDTFTGSANADTLGGFAGNDSLSGGDGNDLLTGGSDGYAAIASGNDTVSGGAGDDTIVATDGTTYLRGDDGNDSIQGGTGFDDINGNKGNDTIAGHSLIGDWLVGGQGDDSITTSTSGNILYGNLGNDTLHGGTGADVLRGGQGDDSIVAGSGNEWISGDRGDDTIQGGSGADTFHTFSGAGLDVVYGFDASKGDHVQVDPGTTYTLSQSGADTLIDMGNGDEMILKNVTLSSLPSGWIFTAW